MQKWVTEMNMNEERVAVPDRRSRRGSGWVNIVLGIWVIISPFVLLLSGAVMWNNVILGIIIAAFALTNTYSKVSAET